MLSVNLLKQARLNAVPSQQWLTWLEVETNQERSLLLEQVSSLTAYPLFDFASNHPIQPEFDLVAYAEMVSRSAIIGKDSAGHLCAILGLPFDQQIGSWLTQFPLKQIYIADPDLLFKNLESYEASFSAVAEAVGLEQVTALEIGRAHV